jgi:DNA-binding PadR family transcriptional regulator
MSHAASVTPQAALLRVLINGEIDAVELIRKIRDWTGGGVDLDEPGLEAAAHALEDSGLVERRHGPPDKRTGQAHVTFALTPAGQASAREILAESLTRKT